MTVFPAVSRGSPSLCLAVFWQLHLDSLRCKSTHLYSRRAFLIDKTLLCSPIGSPSHTPSLFFFCSHASATAKHPWDFTVFVWSSKSQSHLFGNWLLSAASISIWNGQQPSGLTARTGEVFPLASSLSLYFSPHTSAMTIKALGDSWRRRSGVSVCEQTFSQWVGRVFYSKCTSLCRFISCMFLRSLFCLFALFFYDNASGY